MEKDKIDIKYTLCFIKRDDEFLMLNRIKAPNMGLWNGVGGKLEAGEDKFDSIKREIKEETNLDITEVSYHGEVYWHAGDNLGGMYVFTADFPKDIEFETPMDEVEGILAFKNKNWIFDKNNRGVISNIPIFMEKMLSLNEQLKFNFYYDESEKIQNFTWEIIK